MGNGRKFVAIVLALIMVVSFQGSTVFGFCGISISDLMTCKAAASGRRSPNPSRKCCRVLKRANLPCLCTYRDSRELPLLGIDPRLAVRLPAKCGLATPVGCR